MGECAECCGRTGEEAPNWKSLKPSQRMDARLPGKQTRKAHSKRTQKAITAEIAYSFVHCQTCWFLFLFFTA